MNWQFLVVEDDPAIASQIQQYAAHKDGLPLAVQGPVDVGVVAKFEEALARIETTKVDLLILDLKQDAGGPSDGNGESAGEILLDNIKRLRFLPVVVYSNIAYKAAAAANPFVKIVTKADGLECLRDAVKSVFDTGLPEFARFLEAQQREYIWDFVSKRWKEIEGLERNGQLVHLVARRLAAVLDGPAIRPFLKKLGVDTAAENAVHPIDFYVYPAIADEPVRTGTIFNKTVGGKQMYWILLTPACDLAHPRKKDTEHLLFAQCRPMNSIAEVREWLSDPTQGKKKELLKQIIKNNRGDGCQPDRYYFLPGVFDIPNLLADFQALVVVPKDQLPEERLTPIAALDRPYCEELVNRYGRYWGRVGTPDLDPEVVLRHLKSQDGGAKGEKSKGG